MVMILVVVLIGRTGIGVYVVAKAVSGVGRRRYRRLPR